MSKTKRFSSSKIIVDLSEDLRISIDTLAAATMRSRSSLLREAIADILLKYQKQGLRQMDAIMANLGGSIKSYTPEIKS